MIVLKSKREISLMKAAGEIAGSALKLAGEHIKSGVSTFELDSIINRYITKNKAVPSFLNYDGFPGSSCISVNDVVIHGIPSKDLILKPGDIVSIDVGAFYEGFHADTAWTFPCGEISSKVQNLLDVTFTSLDKGIEKAVCGNRIGDISNAVQTYVEARGCAVVRDYVGHGVGTKIHEDPCVPNFGKPHRGRILEEGLVIAIEPMIISGDDYSVEVLNDGWTVISVSGEPAAHFEHTVALTQDGPIVLTKV